MTDENMPLDGVDYEPELLDVEDDESFETAFDEMMSVRLRVALDAAGPSEATEDRILAAILAARGDLGDTAMAASSLAVDEMEPAGLSVQDASPELALAPAPASEMEAVQQMALAAEQEGEPEEPEPAVEPQPRRGVAETSDLTDDLLQLNQGRKKPLRYRYFAIGIAACICLALAVVTISRMGNGVSYRGDSMTAKSEEALESEAVADADGAMPTASESGAAGAPEVVGEAEEAAEYDAAVPTEEVRETGGALTHPEVTLSDGTTLVIVFGGEEPEAVDPTAVGEFVEEAVAYGSDLDDGGVPCEVYRLIAQSDEDGALYAVRYVNDGAFFLAYVA